MPTTQAGLLQAATTLLEDTPRSRLTSLPTIREQPPTKAPTVEAPGARATRLPESTPALREKPIEMDKQDPQAQPEPVTWVGTTEILPDLAVKPLRQATVHLGPAALRPP